MSDTPSTSSGVQFVVYVQNRRVGDSTASFREAFELLVERVSRLRITGTDLTECWIEQQTEEEGSHMLYEHVRLVAFALGLIDLDGCLIPAAEPDLGVVSRFFGVSHNASDISSAIAEVAKMHGYRHIGNR